MVRSCRWCEILRLGARPGPDLASAAGAIADGGDTATLGGAVDRLRRVRALCEEAITTTPDEVVVDASVRDRTALVDLHGAVRTVRPAQTVLRTVLRSLWIRHACGVTVLGAVERRLLRIAGPVPARAGNAVLRAVLCRLVLVGPAGPVAAVGRDGAAGGAGAGVVAAAAGGEERNGRQADRDDEAVEGAHVGLLAHWGIEIA